MINSHTKFGWISFNSKGEDNISDCDDARKYLEIFLFSKSLTYRMCLLVLRCLIYILKGELHNWHLQVFRLSPSVQAVLEYAFSNKYTHRLTLNWLKGDSLEPRGGGGTLIFSHLRRLGPFFGVQNFAFQYFLGFSEK